MFIRFLNSINICILQNRDSIVTVLMKSVITVWSTPYPATSTPSTNDTSTTIAVAVVSSIGKDFS